MKFFIFIFVALINITVFSQSVTVIDKTTLEPLENARLSDASDSKTFVLTNSLGKADVGTLSNAGSITVEAEGYRTMTILYSSIKSNTLTVEMTDRSYTTDEIIVSTNKFNQDLSTLPQEIDVITSRDISFANQQNTGELLQSTGRVLVQKSQLGGGSPIIRGFEASRVLIMVDGVRLNNAIFRAGHLQNVLRIDEAMIDELEIVYGPGSVIYGSDALGGTMNFYTKNPILSPNKKTFFKAGAYGRFSSVNEEKTGHLNFNIGGQKLAFLGSFTFSDFGDMKQGKNTSPFLKGVWDKPFIVERINGRDTALVNEDFNKQVATAYHQYDGMAKVLFQQSKKVEHVLSFRYSNTNDIPRYDRLTEVAGGNPRFAEWYYGPEKWMMGSYKLSLSNMTSFFTQAGLTLAYQDIEESRHDRRFQNRLRNDRTEKVKVYSVNLDFNKQMKNNNISYGLEAYYNDVKSEAVRTDVDADTTGPQSTRYPVDGSKMYTLSAYVTDNWKVHKYVNVTAGVRFSHVNLNADFTTKDFFPFPYDKIEQKQNAFTGNLGVAVNPGLGWRIALMGSSGFRAPNVDDLAKVFESAGGVYVVVPNPDLKPEYAYTGELTLSKIFDNRVKIEGNAYYTMLKDAIVLAPSTFNGADSIIYDGDLTQVVAPTNKNEGYIYGYNIDVNADVTDWFTLYSNVVFTYGRIKTDSTDFPLDHIPPVFGKTGIELKFDKFRGDVNVMYNGWKHIWDYNTIGEDNVVYATSEGMPAWYTLNVKGSYQINKFIQAQIGIENLLDQRYRVFASGISGPGRNISFTLRATY